MNHLLKSCILIIIIQLVAVRSSTISSAGKAWVDQFVCFNTILEISCAQDELIIFDKARYGRNDSAIAARCEVPYTRNCDIDVHFSLNRACSGKRHCSMAVNTAFFGDPCGYEEFLKVSYKCIPASSVLSGCQGSGQHDARLYDRGYIASPNYPGKYFMDAECRWKIAVQRTQTLRMIIYDFELDVKRYGKCHEYLEISSRDRIYFHDCGSLGKQVLDLDIHIALVTFKTGLASLAQRGFLLHFEASRPDCADLGVVNNARTSYYIANDVLYANITCDPGFILYGSDPYESRNRLIPCMGTHWLSPNQTCIAPRSPTDTGLSGEPGSRRVDAVRPVNKEGGRGEGRGGQPNIISDGSGGGEERNGFMKKLPASLLGVVISMMSAIFLVLLLLSLAIYIHKRRQKSNMERRRVVSTLRHCDVTGNDVILTKCTQSERHPIPHNVSLMRTGCTNEYNINQMQQRNFNKVCLPQDYFLPPLPATALTQSFSTKYSILNKNTTKISNSPSSDLKCGGGLRNFIRFDGRSKAGDSECCFDTSSEASILPNGVNLEPCCRMECPCASGGFYTNSDMAEMSYNQGTCLSGTWNRNEFTNNLNIDSSIPQKDLVANCDTTAFRKDGGLITTEELMKDSDKNHLREEMPNCRTPLLKASKARPNQEKEASQQLKKNLDGLDLGGGELIIDDEFTYVGILQTYPDNTNTDTASYTNGVYFNAATSAVENSGRDLSEWYRGSTDAPNVGQVFVNPNSRRAPATNELAIPGCFGIQDDVCDSGICMVEENGLDMDMENKNG